LAAAILGLAAPA